MPEVYPRAYGETTNLRTTSIATWGLSPRLRGNPPRAGPHLFRGWSIPALTGKPLTAYAKAVEAEVYPRAYGETIAERTSAALQQGLSPRLRGNPIAV